MVNKLIKILIVVIIGVATNEMGYSTVPITTIIQSVDQIKTVEMNTKNEIWKDVVGYEGYYQVSNIGRLKSLDRVVNDKRKGLTQIKGKLRKSSINNRGYLSTTLCKDSKYKHCVIHKLMAESFIDNPLNLPMVNHKDGIKTNNFDYNLEWCTCAENNQHAYDTGLKIGAATGMFGKDNKSSKPVLQIDIATNNIIAEFECVHDVYRKLGFAVTNVACACRGKSKTSFGYKWKYKLQ